MEWGNRNDAAWERGLEEARKFREQFGNLQVPGEIQNERWLSSGKVDQQCAETSKRWKADGRAHSTTGSDGNDMERI